MRSNRSYRGDGTAMRRLGVDTLAQLPQVPPEDGLFTRTILQAGEVGFEQGRSLLGQTIKHPLALPLGCHHTVAAQISQMTRNLGLRFSDDILQMADAERSPEQQMHDAQTRAVTKALVDPDQVHAGKHIRADEYVSSGKKSGSVVQIRILHAHATAR